MRRSLRDPAWLAAVTARRAPPFAADLRVWIDPDDLDGAKNSTLVSGNPIDTIVNKGTLGGTFVGATGGRPTYQPVAGAGGGPCMRFSATAGTPPTSSLAASAFAFMHDGSGCTIYTVIKVSTSHVGNILGTATGQTTSRGMGHRVQTTFRAGYFMGDGTALRININSANNVVSSGLHHIYSTRLADDSPDMAAHVDGASAMTANAAAFSALDPASALVLGRTPIDSARLVGDLGDTLVYAGFHDDTQRAAVEAWLTSKRGAFPQ